LLQHWSFYSWPDRRFYDAVVTLETSFQLVFAAAIVLAAAALVAAALERTRPRTLLVVVVVVGVATTAAWVGFAFAPSREMAITAAGTSACLLASLGALALRRGLIRSRAVDRDIQRLRAELNEIVGRELRQRGAELEHALARARADSLSSFGDAERRLSEERRRTMIESEQRARATLSDALAGVQHKVEQRLAGWTADLQRAEQRLTAELVQLERQQRELILQAEAKIAGEAERLRTTDEEQRAGIARLREELTKAAHEAAAAADVELEGHAADRRRALHEIDERLRVRERDLSQRIDREQTDAERRIKTTFADVERRQVEQLERVLERAASRFSDAASQQFEQAIKSAREEAARRLSRELDRSVQAFAREGEALLAERLSQVGDAGEVRLEKKLAKVAQALERQRQEFVATSERRLADLEADFRGRLTAFAAEEDAERAALEARLHELARRIHQTLAQAEERVESLARR
jgi:hypothetical protein